MKKSNEGVLTEQFLLKALVENNKILRREMNEAIEANNRVLRLEINDSIEANNHVLKREIRDEIHSVVNGAVAVSERRTIERIDSGILASERRMVAHTDGAEDSILEAISELVLPRIKKNSKSIVRLNYIIGIAEKSTA